MTSVIDSTGVRKLTPEELDEALQALIAEQQQRHISQRMRSDIACAFVLMGSGLRGCRLLDFEPFLEWRVTPVARTSLSGAAEMFAQIASEPQTTVPRMVLQSLAAECHHLIGEHKEAAALATRAVKAYQEPEDLGPIVGHRLAVCVQMQAGKTLDSTAFDALAELQDLVLA
jgi:hypothetical protein